MRRVIVVGAGAAGLTAAIRAGEAGARVTLLNAHPKVGLKILMSGGTRCNVTHREVSPADYHGGSRHFVARVLRAFTVPQTLQWFESMGVRLKLEATGKYFPETDDAQTVLDALLGAAARAGVELRPGARAVRLACADGGFAVGVQAVRDSAAFAEVSAVGRATFPSPEAAGDETLAAERVVLATGGLSFPRTGSDGVGYALAASLGHTIEPTVPALTPLASSHPWCRELQGITTEAALSLWVEGGREEVVCGSLLFAHFGFSGPAALDLSRHWLRASMSGEARVTASFLPRLTREALALAWHAEGRTAVRRFLHALPERLVDALCARAGVVPSAPLGQVPSTARAALFTALLESPLDVTGTLGYEKAEVTAGGVRTSEVNPSTLESRKAPGLFLCGEILDVEGRLGGFNFQFSWSSGTVAGRAAASR